jgi:hypothetical protein
LINWTITINRVRDTFAVYNECVSAPCETGTEGIPGFETIMVEELII